MPSGFAISTIAMVIWMSACDGGRVAARVVMQQSSRDVHRSISRQANASITLRYVLLLSDPLPRWQLQTGKRSLRDFGAKAPKE